MLMFYCDIKYLFLGDVCAAYNIDGSSGGNNNCRAFWADRPIVQPRKNGIELSRGKEEQGRFAPAAAFCRMCRCLFWG